jgi:5-formyltetrahydrofolate cyclo-ligase
MSEDELSSPACSMHELEHLAPPKSQSWEDIHAWREKQRKALLRPRQAMEAGERQQRAAPIIARLIEALETLKPSVLGIYYPFKGEIDLRDLADRHIASGGITALPVVVKKDSPVEFWQWRPGEPMSRGLFNIPVPAERHEVIPDLIIAPLVGFDRAGYRLGYGSGYYDRTLAASQQRPYTIGIAFAEAELATIYPQPHDIPMNRIVTDRFAFDVA